MTPTVWHWFALGGALLLLELATPGFVFLWLALAAGLTGILLALFPGLTWQIQVLGFAVAAVVSVGLAFWWRRRLPPAAGDPSLNRRALTYVGTEAELVASIGPGHGRVRIADSTWSAAGPELPAARAFGSSEREAPSCSWRRWRTAQAAAQFRETRQPRSEPISLGHCRSHPPGSRVADGDRGLRRSLRQPLGTDTGVRSGGSGAEAGLCAVDGRSMRRPTFGVCGSPFWPCRPRPRFDWWRCGASIAR